MVALQNSAAPVRRNPTLMAIQALLDRGWSGKNAWQTVIRWYDAGDFESIRRLAACQRGSAATEYCLQAACLGLALLAVIGTVQLGIDAAWTSVSTALADETAPVLRP